MLQDVDFVNVYSSGTKNNPRAFFTKALENSVSFDLGLGFFSTASINVLSLGFAKFIVNGGKMRLYINQYLTEEDRKLLTEERISSFNEKIMHSYAEMLAVLSRRDKHFFECLSYLISQNRISIKVIIPNSGGIAHQKFGVFTDLNGNKIGFIGSVNFTANAITSKNIESLSCDLSWDGGEKKILAFEKSFDDYYNGEMEGVQTYALNELSKQILTKFPPKDVDVLIKEEEELVKNESFGDLVANMPETKPHFPYPEGPRQYQKDAYSRWVTNGLNGIFAMATGTGKTITSLNCALEEYCKSGFYHLLILVPTNDLVNQWVGEVGKFGYKNIYIVNGDNNWRDKLINLKNDFDYGISQDFVIISTYASFTNNVFQEIIKALSAFDMILIADEAHNVGSDKVRDAFKNLTINKRIALSATPNRAYDIEGTKAIETYFKDQPPYCYSFSMEKAIKEGRLCEYNYFPRVATLDSSEMAKYKKYTKALLKYYNSRKHCFEMCKECEDLLMARKRLIHKAHDKIRVFNEIMEELASKNKYKYCFVYSPEGIDYSTDNNEKFIFELQKEINRNHPEITTNTFLGGDSEKQSKLRAFAEGKINILLAMKCLDEGVDVPRAEVGVFTSSTGNPRQFIQRRGRLLRTCDEKHFAYIYDIVVAPDKSAISPDTFDMERSLVKNELIRVAYFASLAINYNVAISYLKDLTDYYDFEISTLISELKEQ